MASRIIAAASLVGLLFAVPALADENLGGEPAVAATAVVATDASEASRTAIVQRPWSPLSRPAVLPFLYGGSIVLQAFDAYSTLKVLNVGGVESNPAMQGMAGNRAAFIGTKAAVSAASILAAERLWKNHHRVGAIVLMATSNALMTAVAAHNASVMSSVQR